MKPIKFLLLFLAFVVGGGALHAQPFLESNVAYEDGAIYLKVKDTSGFQIQFPYPSGWQYIPVYRYMAAYGVTNLEKPFNVLSNTRLDRIYKVYFTATGQTDQFISSLESISYIEYAEKVPEKEVNQTVPNDPFVPNGSYQLGLINAYDAFDIHQGGSVIAIVDDAVLTTHEDLAANIIGGRDVADQDNDPNPPFTGANAANPNRFSHGTHVGGIAGGVTNNATGIASIGWNNQILAVKTVRDNAANPRIITHGYEGIAWAAANGAEVINLSWGGGGFAQAEYDVIVAAQQAGAIIVASAGNAASAQPNYPAAYGEGTTGEPWETANGNLVIAVASIDADGDISLWGQGPFGPLGSNFGAWVDIASYGTAILSTVANSSNGNPVNNQYASYNGTSMAAPLISGLLGLMLSYNGTASDADVLNCLFGTANDDIYGPAHPGNLPGSLGAGRPDALAALQCLATDCDDDPIAIITASSEALCANGSVQLTANPGIAYAWSTGATTQSITITATGTYTVTVTFPGNCTDAASIDIDNAITEATIIVSDNSGIASNDGIMCGTGFLFLTAYWGNAYQWSAFGATTQSVGPINAGNNLPFFWNYAVTVTGVGGCPGVNDVVTGTAMWLLPPTAAINVQENSQTPNDGIICQGASATLNATGGQTYAWNTGATTANITVSPTVNTTYTVTVTDANGCTDAEQTLIQVVECLACPCTAANTLNINASPNGSLYSQLEAQFNYDVNNDGVLDATDHNGCISISGRLIINQNLTIRNCQDVRMQPCAEIVVQAQRTLNMTQNNIYGCETMWRGISVEAFGRLIFTRNTIQDAQQAITATASGWFWPPVGNLSTIIEVQRNRFIRNHIGVMVPGPAGGNLAHAPFSNNNFIGNGTPLLPPCDAGLANWNATNGYAGVVTQGVSFVVGAATDVGITNTFSGLRNGVIGESAWLQVHHASFSDMAGEWVDEAQTPAFGNSFGMGVLTTLGVSSINDSYFDGVGHGVYSRMCILAALRNDMPSVRRGIEADMPFGFTLSENTDIVYRNRGIIARNLQTSVLSQWLQYAINKNLVRNFDLLTTEGDMAIEVREGNSPNLTNARISENKIFLDASEGGIFVRGVGNWTIDQNYIQYSPNNGTAPTGLGIGLLNSPLNYLYANTVEDIGATGALSRGFNIANSAENTLCCNVTDGTRLGFRFFGACGATHFRTSDMNNHETALEISLNGIIGDQGPFIPIFGGFFLNNNNLFAAGSGNAVHLATSNAVVQASRFHVLDLNNPNHPDNVVLQPGITDPWFHDDGVFVFGCEVCEVPPAVPDVRGKEIDEADKTVAGPGFGIGTLRDRNLQWEASRSLYDRMKRYTELHNVDNDVDNFYSDSDANDIGSYYEADRLVSELSTISSTVEAAIAFDVEKVNAARDAYEAKLAELANATTWEDSLAIYRQADSILMTVSGNVGSIVDNIKTALNDRELKAQDAIPVIEGLSATDVYMENRRDVLKIYAQTIGQNNYLLSAAQAATIDAIAHQCPEEGGSAVLLAQAIQLMVAPEDFDDEILCRGGRERDQNGKVSGSEFGVEMIPNPASTEVMIVLPTDFAASDVHIALINVSGQTVLEKHSVEGQAIVQLPLSNLPDGLYLCQVRAEGIGTSVHKLVVKH